MNTETKPKKESKLDIDSNYDLRLVSTLSPVLRWILVLPIAFLAMFVIQIGYGFIVKLILSNFAQDGFVSIIGNSTVMLAKYTVFVIVATSTAPVARNKKFIVAIVSALIGALLCVGGTAIAISVAVSTDNTMLIATFVASIVGLLLGIWKVRSSISKPVAEEDKASQL
ncbi:flagellar biosynthesis protein FliQ [Prevotella sp.]|uniref:flagellar biosynthesis protein FliQ n=1 Tax=Prevotella sp. TaxID=59823 RepID=UPI001CAADD2F|nr:flagellar biosynthesis protein FliQ [Prevotella sp.]MBF1596647.1 flagellar biosynthesis protein FliQ [Prevotella sp.]